MKKKKSIPALLLLMMCISLISPVSIKSDPPPLIRLHVVANSNSLEDQLLKYKVRDEVIKTTGAALKGAQDICESREILLSNLTYLEQSAESVLKEAGCRDSIGIFYGEYDFPAKNYGMFTLPAGRYEAVRMVIGEGQGANWWCVLFPPLCFVSAEKEGDKHGLSEPGTLQIEQEALEKIKLAQSQKIQIKPAFKIIELLKALFKRLKREAA